VLSSLTSAIVSCFGWLLASVVIIIKPPEEYISKSLPFRVRIVHFKLNPNRVKTSCHGWSYETGVPPKLKYLKVSRRLGTYKKIWIYKTWVQHERSVKFNEFLGMN
jgi:hypothetical protein